MIAITWLKLHWLTIAYGTGVWALFASALNRVAALTPDEKSPRWKRFVHSLLIDWPAALPKVDFRGLFGLPVNVPYLTLSTSDGVGNKDLIKLLIVGFLGSALLGGCLSSKAQANEAASKAAALKQAAEGAYEIMTSSTFSVSRGCEVRLIGDGESVSINCTDAKRGWQPVIWETVATANAPKKKTPPRVLVRRASSTFEQNVAHRGTGFQSQMIMFNSPGGVQSIGSIRVETSNQTGGVTAGVVEVQP